MSSPVGKRRTIPSPIPGAAAKASEAAAAVEGPPGEPDAVERRINEQIAAAIAAGTVNPDEPIVVAVDAAGYVSVSNAVPGSPQDASEDVDASETAGVNEPVVFSDLHAEFDNHGNKRLSAVDIPGVVESVENCWGF